MKNRSLLIVVVAVVAAVLAYIFITSSSDALQSPKLSKKHIDTIIDSQAQELKANGFEISKSADETQAVVVDDTQAKRYIIKRIDALVPDNAKSAWDDVKGDFLHEDTVSLEGMSVVLKPYEDKESAKLKVALSSLPKVIDHELKEAKGKQKALAQQLQGLFEEQKLFALLSFDKEGGILGVQVGDIQEKLALNEEEYVHIVSKGLKQKSMQTGATARQIELEYQELLVAMQTQKESGSISLNDLQAQSSQSDVLNSNSITTLKELKAAFSEPKYKYDYKTYERIKVGTEDIKAALKNLKITTKTQTKEGKAYSAFSAAIDTVEIENSTVRDTLKATIKNFVWGASIANANEQALRDILSFIDERLDGNMGRQDREEFMRLAQIFTQKGFTVSIDDLNMKHLKATSKEESIEIGDVKLNIKATLPANDIPLMQFGQYLPLLDVTAHLSMDKKDYEALKDIDKQYYAMAQALKVEKGESVVFDVEFKKGAITVNGKPLQ